MSKALKSFETNVVGRTSDWNGFIATLAIGYTFLSGVFAWVAKNLTRFGNIGWAEAVFIGLGASALVALLFCAILVAWRVFRPLVSSAPDTTIAAPASLQIPHDHEVWKGIIQLQGE